MPYPSPRQLRALAAAVVIVLAVGGYAIRRRPPERVAAVSDAMDERRRPPTFRPGPPPPFTDTTPEGDPRLPINHRLRGSDGGDLVKNFDLATTYPPGVRLLLPYQQHLIDPDRYEDDLVTAPLPSLRLSDEEQADARRLAEEGLSRSEIRKRLLAGKGFDHLPRYRLLSADNNVTPGETFVALIEVVDEQRRPLSHTIRKAVVLSDPVFGDRALGGVAMFQPEEGRPARVEWRAPSEDRLHWGDLRLEVDLEIGGDVGRITHSFRSTPFKVAELTGQYAERVVDGSLEIRARLLVHQPGECTFSVLLYDDGTGRPIARATHMEILEAGPHEVPFLFYGKVFHDAGFHKGRLALRQARGECRRRLIPAEFAGDPRAYYLAAQRESGIGRGGGAITSEPDVAHLPTVPLAYRTRRPYSVVEFTSTAWDSPEKRRYRELLSATQASREARRTMPANR